MISTTVSSPSATTVAHSYPELDTFHTWRSRLSWGSILAGSFAALALHIVLSMLGMSLGIAIVNPKPYQNDLPAVSIAVGLGWCLAALISLWVGGWIAGRTAPRGIGNSGGIHGVLVWCLATVATVTFVTSGGGMLVGGALKAAGGGAARAVDVVSAQVGQSGGRAVDFTSPTGLVGSFLDEASGQTAARENAPGDTARARRETGAALARFFTQSDASSRDALVSAVASYSGKSRADAESTVRSWEETYKRTLADAETAAARAAKKAAAAAAWTCLAFCIGAFFAAWGGRCGGLRYSKLYILDPAPYDPRAPFVGMRTAPTPIPPGTPPHIP